MLKTITRSLALPAVVLTLAGCTEVKALFDNGPTVEEVQALTVKGCSFVPTKDTVQNIIGAGSPGLTTSLAIANAVCSAIAPKAGVGAGKSTVAGVPIEGLRVK